MIWSIEHRATTPLQEQIASCVRRGIASGELAVGEQLPPAAELAEALGVDRNTVLAAYRRLRDDGALEFRRGRGARVAPHSPPSPAVVDAARDLLTLARANGLDRTTLVRLIQELP